MKKLIFEGYSDDTFGETSEGLISVDTSAEEIPVMLKVHSESQDKTVFVIGQYAFKGISPCWMVGIMPIDSVPNWNIRVLKGEESYSAAIQMFTPDDVKVYHIKKVI